MKTLLLDNDPISLRYIEKLLSKNLGCHCDLACAANTAIDFFRTAIDTGNYYDLVIMEVCIPEITGIDVLKRIREYEKKHPENSAKTIMISASSKFDAATNSLIEMADLFLEKPLKKTPFIQSIKKLFDSESNE